MLPAARVRADGSSEPLDDFLEAAPFEFLPYMVRINELLEAGAAGDEAQPEEGDGNDDRDTHPPRNKLFSPLILRTSFIPTHITIDTTGMLHLFVDDVAEFKAWYAQQYGTELGMATKADLASGLAKLLQRPVTKEEEAVHAERCWEYVATIPSRLKLQTRVLKKRAVRRTASAPPPDGASAPPAPRITKAEAARRKAVASIHDPADYSTEHLRFQRIVMTDGYNLSALLTSAPDARGKVLGSRSGRPTPLPELSPDTAGTFRHYLDQEAFKVIGCDPGKVDIVRMGDGTTTLNYSAARRRRECRFLWNSRNQEAKKTSRRFPELRLGLAAIPGAPSVKEIESLYLRQFSSRSCTADGFAAYLSARSAVDAQLTSFYCGAYFR